MRLRRLWQNLLQPPVPEREHLQRPALPWSTGEPGRGVLELELGADRGFFSPPRQHHQKYQHVHQKTFTCSEPTCGKSFNFKKHLKEHEKLHSGEWGSSMAIMPPPLWITPPWKSSCRSSNSPVWTMAPLTGITPPFIGITPPL